MNKPITNRVRNGAWGKDAVHQPSLKTGEVESPAKQTEGIVLSETTPGETKTKQVEEKVEVAGDVLNTPDAVAGGEAGDGYNQAMLGYLGEGQTYEQMAAAGHGTVEGLKARFPGYEGNTGRGPSTEKTITKTETYKTPDTKTSYTPQIEKTTDAITPWENRWNRRVDKQNERWARQEARKDLRNIAKQEARNIRQEGGGFGEGWKARRDVMTGRANLSAKEQELYNTSRGIDSRLQEVIDTRRGRDQLEQGASGNDKVKSVYDFTMADAGTAEGEQTLKKYERNLGGKPELETSKGSGSSASGANRGGLAGRKAARQSAKQAGKNKAAYEAEARKKGEAEVARKAEAEKASRSPMYMQNVGFKAKSPLKKGYFK